MPHRRATRQRQLCWWLALLFLIGSGTLPAARSAASSVGTHDNQPEPAAAPQETTTKSSQVRAPWRELLNAEQQAFLDSHPRLRVGNETDWPPFDFVVDHEPAGYGIDLIKRLAAGLGIELVFVSGPPWTELQEQLADGRLDLLPALYKTRERAERFVYSRAYLDTQLVIVAREEQDTPAGPGWLNGRLVGVEQGDGGVLAIQRLAPTAELRFFDRYLDALLALASGDVDAVVGGSLPTYYLANQHHIFNLRVADYLRPDSGADYSTALHFAVTPELAPLTNILNTALDSLPREDWQDLDQRWFRNLLTIDREGELPLTPAERTYLDQKGLIRVCVTPDWLPYERFSTAAGHQGIGAELSELIAARLGVDLTIYPTETRGESLAGLRTGDCDILTIAMDLPSRREFLRFSPPYSEQPFVIAARRDTPYIARIEQLGQQPLGVLLDSAQMELLRTRYPDLNLVPVANPGEGLKRVQDEELFGYIDSLATISYEVQTQGLLNIRVAGTLDTPLLLSIATRGDAPLLATAVHKALANIGQTEIDRIVNRWLSAPYEPEVEMDYTLAWQVLVGAAALLLGLYFWNLRLARANRALANAQLELAQKTRELARLSVTDSLTQLNNRLKLDTTLTAEIERTRRSGQPLSLILFDIDYFKHTNDTHGHQIGDQVLVGMADLLRRQCRRVDIVGRWGGEEFLMICPDTELAPAVEIAERIREAIKAEDFDIAGQQAASFGVASFQLGDCARSLLGRADAALYAAKNRGRDRVVSELDLPPGPDDTP